MTSTLYLATLADLMTSRQRAVATGAGAAAIAAAVFVHAFVAARQGLDCRDFDNTSWTGEPTSTRIVRDISSPRFITMRADESDRFSTECTGWLYFEIPTIARFVLGSDDGAVLAIDGGRLVDNSGPHLMRYLSGEREMSPGPHALSIRYAQEGGEHGFVLLHSRDETMPAPLPRWMISRRPLTRVEHLIQRRQTALEAMLLILGVVLMSIAQGRSIGRAIKRFIQRQKPSHDALLQSQTRMIGVLLAISIVTRVMVALASSGILWPDSVVYYETATAYLRGNWAFHEIVRTPGYPAFLAVFLARGETELAGEIITLMQHVLGIGSTLIVFAIGRQIFSTAAAFYGALLWSLSPLQMYSETVIQTEVLFTVLLLLSLWLTLRVVAGHHSTLTFVSLGALYATTTLTRPVAKAFILIVLTFLLWRLRQYRAKAVLVTLGAYLAIVAPWMYVNSQTFGFFGINRGEGVSLYFRAFDVEGLRAPAGTAFPEVRDAQERLLLKTPILYYRLRNELDYQLGYSALQADDTMRGFAIEAITRHPIAFAGGLAYDWLRIFVAPYRTIDVCRERPWQPYLCASPHRQMTLPAFSNQPPPGRDALKQAVTSYVEWSYSVFRLLPPLGLLGAILMLRQSPDRSIFSLRVLLLVVIVYFTSLAVAFSTSYDRLRLPIDPLLMLFAAAMAITLVRRLSGLRYDATNAS